MWGTLGRGGRVARFIRFIPTHVGNTGVEPRRTWPPAVHPHACGEHTIDPPKAIPMTGSSPRMWGTRHCRSVCRGRCRFIPTHVGNTALPPGYQKLGPVHPHACGEHLPVPPATRIFAGSSPRMWGTRGDRRTRRNPRRFIPTHVGNTSNPLSGLSGKAVHPHACGEHRRPSCQTFIPSGSSPRMWGTPVPGDGDVQIRRFIPTHVGNTENSRIRVSADAVHPHACGEHTISNVLLEMAKNAGRNSTGESPL